MSEPVLTKNESTLGSSRNNLGVTLAGPPTSRIEHGRQARSQTRTSGALGNNFDVRLLGADILSNSRQSDELFKSFSFTIDPTMYTPKGGFNLGKIVTYHICRQKIFGEPSRFMIVALPGFGSEAGGRNSSAMLRNLGQLVTAHLTNTDNHVIIDGAIGNPAWSHVCSTELVKHPRLQHNTEYFWCASGATEHGKPIRRKSKAVSSFPLNHVNEWRRCCGK